MICLALGLGALGFMAMRKARHCHRYAHCHGWHGYGGFGAPWGGYGPPWGGPPWARGRHGRHGLHMALAHIDASPAQERAIIHEVEQLQTRLHATKSGMKDARGDLAAAIRNPSLDEAALGAVLGRVDTATADARSAVLDAIVNIHKVLDDRQREQLADLLDHGWWRRSGGPTHGGGPYRV